MTTTASDTLIRAASLAEVRERGPLAVRLDGFSVALFAEGDRVYAVDNRCPHMGYPLTRGTVRDCVLTCHWHHARFDLTTGGTFDQWADDVRAFPVEVRGGEVWVDLAAPADPVGQQRARMEVGLERNISLVLAKSSISLAAACVPPEQPFRAGLEFGVRNRQAGWGQGLTIHTCMFNLLPHLAPEERPRAMYHGLSAVARDTAGSAPRFPIRPLPDGGADIATLKRWLRRFVEVRDAEGAERCVVTAVRAGADERQLGDMLFAAATDHRYIQTGHPLDFTSKALEALDAAGWAHAEPVLASLVRSYADASRMEESNAWRSPIDLVAILESTFERLPSSYNWTDTAEDTAPRASLVPTLHGDDPQAIADALLAELERGAPPTDLAGAVAYAAVLRIARFHTNNEFGDWDTALHTFTFANAVHQGLRRTRSVDLVRGLFDAAMSVYLDRFLNSPPARLPEPSAGAPVRLDEELADLLDRQQQVSEAGALVARALGSGTTPAAVIAALGRMLLREDRDFHTIQCVEAAVRQSVLLRGAPEASHVLIAAARYLAAHSPTVRAQGQTYEIARRLQRGDNLYEEG